MRAGVCRPERRPHRTSLHPPIPPPETADNSLFNQNSAFPKPRFRPVAWFDLAVTSRIDEKKKKSRKELTSQQAFQ